MQSRMTSLLLHLLAIAVLSLRDCYASCSDTNQHCRSWASRGECNKNPSYMHNYCKKSCGKCGDHEQNQKQLNAAVRKFAYVGCYKDNPANRLLKNVWQSHYGMTIDACGKYCSDKGAKFYGLEYSFECWCGNSPSAASYEWARAANSDCNMACTGESASICGGLSRISLYKMVKLGDWSQLNFAQPLEPQIARLLGVETASCTDINANCAGWERQGKCWTDNYVIRNCRKSCNTCERPPSRPPPVVGVRPVKPPLRQPQLTKPPVGPPPVVGVRPVKPPLRQPQVTKPPVGPPPNVGVRPLKPPLRQPQVTKPPVGQHTVSNVAAVRESEYGSEREETNTMTQEHKKDMRHRTRINLQLDIEHHVTGAETKTRTHKVNQKERGYKKDKMMRTSATSASGQNLNPFANLGKIDKKELAAKFMAFLSQKQN